MFPVPLPRCSAAPLRPFKCCFFQGIFQPTNASSGLRVSLHHPLTGSTWSAGRPKGYFGLSIAADTTGGAGDAAWHRDSCWVCCSPPRGEKNHGWVPARSPTSSTHPSTPQTGGPRAVGGDRSLTAQEVWLFVFLCD